MKTLAPRGRRVPLMRLSGHSLTGNIEMNTGAYKNDFREKLFVIYVALYFIRFYVIAPPLTADGMTHDSRNNNMILVKEIITDAIIIIYAAFTTNLLIEFSRVNLRSVINM